MSDEATPGPWRIDEHRNQRGHLTYIRILGPNDEKICDLFPDAGVGGVGADVARQNARLIIEARGVPKPPKIARSHRLPPTAAEQQS